MTTQMKVTGGRELQAALLELKTAVARRIGRQAVQAAAEPILATMQARVPHDEDMLAQSLGMNIRTRTDRRSGAAEIVAKVGIRKAKAGDYEVTKDGKRAVGSAPAGYGQFIEFGRADAAAQPFLRPAWDSEGGEAAIGRITTVLKDGISKAAKRAAKAAGKA